MVPKHVQLQIFIQANITVGRKLKTCQGQPHLVCGCFIKLFYKTTTYPRWPLLNGPKSGCNFFFFNCYLAVPRPTLGHSQGDSLTNLMLITVFVQVRPEGHWEPCNNVGSLSPVECLTGFEPGNFQFSLQHLNPLGHSTGLTVYPSA